MGWCERTLDKFESRFIWAFDPCLFIWICFFVGLLCGLAYYFGALPGTMGALVAAFGAFMASTGVITIGRPLIRSGGYRAWHEKQQTIDMGHIEQTHEEIIEESELRRDAVALQITGPALVIVGTMMNGLSGFFS